jgi:hypothetical protein
VFALQSGFRGEQRPESSPRRSTRVTAPSIGRPFVLLRPKSIETFRIQAGASQAARLHWDERTSPHTGKGRRLTAHTSEWSLPIAAGASRGGKLPLFSNRPGFGRGRSSRSTNTYHRRCGPAFWREQRHQGTSAICALPPFSRVPGPTGQSVKNSRPTSICSPRKSSKASPPPGPAPYWTAFRRSVRPYAAADGAAVAVRLSPGVLDLFWPPR